MNFTGLNWYRQSVGVLLLLVVIYIKGNINYVTLYKTVIYTVSAFNIFTNLITVICVTYCIQLILKVIYKLIRHLDSNQCTLIKVIPHTNYESVMNR